MEISERELVQKAKSGDKTAQAEIVSKFERMVFNLGLKLLGNQEEAECILQETFLKVLESLPGFKGDSQLSTWIYRIATNQALMRLRKRKREYITLSMDNEFEMIDYSRMNQSFASNPLNNLLTIELREKMNDAIELLSPKFKSVFVLKDIEGLSLKEISEITKMSIPAVKSNLHRARLFLRNKLSEFIDGKNGYL